jgi:hypothetical protein
MFQEPSGRHVSPRREPYLCHGPPCEPIPCSPVRTLALLLSLVLAGCSAGAPAPKARVAAAAAPAPNLAAVGDDPLSAAALMRDVVHLAGPTYRGRGSATEDEARAAAWIRDETIRAGARPLGATREQPFSALGHGPSRNVIAVVAAKRPLDDRVVIVGAHYDHDGVKDGRIYPGADDNASGTAAVLGVLRVLAEHPERIERTVVFVFFGAEERGLLGSYAFVRANLVPPVRIVAMINSDMLGRPLQDQPAFRFAQKLVGIDAEHSTGIAGAEKWPWLEQIVKDACAAEGHRAIGVDDLPESLRPAARRATTGRSDHYPFELAGVPAMIFSSGESVDYHQPTDTAETLRPDLLATRARILLRTVEQVSRTGEADPRAK